MSLPPRLVSLLVALVAALAYVQVSAADSATEQAAHPSASDISTEISALAQALRHMPSVSSTTLVVAGSPLRVERLEDCFVLGERHLSGLTRHQLAGLLTERLRSALPVFLAALSQVGDVGSATPIFNRFIYDRSSSWAPTAYAVVVRKRPQPVEAGVKTTTLPGFEKANGAAGVGILVTTPFGSKASQVSGQTLEVSFRDPVAIIQTVDGAPERINLPAGTRALVRLDYWDRHARVLKGSRGWVTLPDGRQLPQVVDLAIEAIMDPPMWGGADVDVVVSAGQEGRLYIPSAAW